MFRIGLNHLKSYGPSLLLRKPISKRLEAIEAHCFRSTLEQVLDAVLWPAISGPTGPSNTLVIAWLLAVYKNSVPASVQRSHDIFVVFITYKHPSPIFKLRAGRIGTVVYG